MIIKMGTDRLVGRSLFGMQCYTLDPPGPAWHAILKTKDIRTRYTTMRTPAYSM